MYCKVKAQESWSPDVFTKPAFLKHTSNSTQKVFCCHNEVFSNLLICVCVCEFSSHSSALTSPMAFIIHYSPSEKLSERDRLKQLPNHFLVIGFQGLGLSEEGCNEKMPRPSTLLLLY